MARILQGEAAIVRNLRIANNPLTRLTGLGWIREFPEGAGLLIKPCNSVHTFWPAFPIDVVFLTRDLGIVRMCPELAHRRLSPVVWAAHQVLELPAGTISRFQLAEGQMLTLER